MKKRDKILLIIFLFLSLIWTILVYFNVFNEIDSIVYYFVISFKKNFTTSLFKVITFLSSIKFITLIFTVSILLMIITKNKLYILITLLSPISSFINLFIKNIIKRKRPDKIYWLVKESNYSFPSGHSMIAIILYGFLMYLIYKSKLSKIFKIILLVLLSILILFIGISRIYLGVHYASDVIGGFLWGFTLLILFINFGKKGNLI